MREAEIILQFKRQCQMGVLSQCGELVGLHSTMAQSTSLLSSAQQGKGLITVPAVGD